MHDLRISTNDRRTERSKHLVADVRLFSASPFFQPQAGSGDQHNNESMIMGLAILRVAPKISFLSIVKPVCLPLPHPDDESSNDAAVGSTMDLLFAGHAAVNDENDDATDRGSAVTSLITGSHDRKKDLTLVTDQRLEISHSVCTQILSSNGMQYLLQHQEKRPVMCALNSPLFTLNCRVII